MSLAIVMPNRPCEPLKSALQGLLPEVPVQCWPDIQRPESVTFALLWKQPPGLLAQWPALRGVMSYGAGADFILDDPDLPAGLPVGRTVTPGLITEMREHVAALVLSERRRLPHYWRQQQAAQWDPGAPGLGRRVAVLGLGALGLPCAEFLNALGFEVIGFSRTRPAAAQAGWNGPWYPLSDLKEHAPSLDFIVSLLPFTPDTRACLNQELFGQMRPESCLINVSRGEVLDETALLASLARGRPGSACLDVFAQEPLPAEHPFWRHPRVRVTPHVAALTDPEEAAQLIAQTYHQAMRGERLSYEVLRC